MPADRGLAAWVRAIVGALEAADPVGAATLRGVAARRSARIGLDDEWVAVGFDDHGALRVRRVDGPGTGPWGRSSRGTVVDVLAARVEVRDAVLTGDVEVVGTVAEVAAMIAVIEIVLDAAMRAPALQALADELVAAVGAPTGPGRAPVPWYPDEIAPAELRLLRALGLLADPPAATG
ncbi:hypothetical protein [Cellulomonas alba]|uniref:PH domain-containing protein n=1 Tax=Cellulomonas alba TaxID=3053467 RepID=A0ABT7SD99_9CELL|nr:hypothetical protein [Cellulomonas alba]MDM7853547.1 hypothetical protein [Cellulomonas alba]